MAGSVNWARKDSMEAVVVKVDSLLLQQKLGATTRSPRWAIAYKFQAVQETTVLESIEIQVGRTGTETVALSFGDVPLTAGSVLTVVANGLLADKSLNAIAAADNLLLWDEHRQTFVVVAPRNRIHIQHGRPVTHPGICKTLLQPGKFPGIDNPVDQQVNSHCILASAGLDHIVERRTFSPAIRQQGNLPGSRDRNDLRDGLRCNRARFCISHDARFLMWRQILRGMLVTQRREHTLDISGQSFHC